MAASPHNSFRCRSGRWLLALGVFWTTGCQEKPDLSQAASGLAASSRVEPAASAPPTVLFEATSSAKAVIDDQETKTESAVDTTNYAPPFPDRVDLFAVPERNGGSRRRGDSSVELIGFARLDVPRVVLSFDGQIAPLAVGGVRHGVEVISIEPPTVVLQRGRQRWQTSLPQ